MIRMINDSMGRYDRYSKALDRLSEEDNLRVLRNLKQDGLGVIHEGRRLLNLSSNDYLSIGSRGLTGDGNRQFGACSSRLLTGNYLEYDCLERLLAELYDAEAALVFNSGYHANLGILPALTTDKDLILADKLVHASLIDGMRLSAAKVVRFPHNDLAFVDRLLAADRARYDRVFLVTESVFSMDGDVSDLVSLVELKRKHDVFLYVDEAHAVGTHGAQGLGLAEACRVVDEIDFLVGTFGKAVASVGAFLICSSVIRAYLINSCRPLIFSTALPPASLAFSMQVMQMLPSMGEQRANLQRRAEQLRQGVVRLGYTTGGSTQIVPLITGDSAVAVRLSRFLVEQGVLALPIRRPTVPAGGERIRFSLTADLTEQQIDDLLALIAQFRELTNSV